MTAAVEGEILRDSRRQGPSPEFERGLRGILEQGEDEILRCLVPLFSEIRLGDLGNVEVFLTAGLLLLENESRVTSS